VIGIVTILFQQEPRRISVKKYLALATVAVAALSATPAAAQAVSGPRVEALVGYDSLRYDLEDVGIDDSFRDEGVLYGVGVGYDFALGNGAAIGVDLEASDSTAKETNVAGELKASRDLYAGGRVSLPLGADGSNVYVKGGYTRARFLASDGLVRDSENLDGYRIGAGAQFALSGKAYVGGEYRYSNYEADVSRQQLALTVGTRF
jgi:outer membrane immunogenic protein